MKLQYISVLLWFTLLLSGCAEPAEPEPAILPEPVVTTEPTMEPFMNDVSDPIWISGEIRDYFAGLGTDANGTDIPIAVQDERGLPYARVFRYEVSEIDLRQYVEETLAAHFLYHFEDVISSESDYIDLFADTNHPGVLKEYRLVYAGEDIGASLAAVKDGTDMICFVAVYDGEEGFDTEALISQTLPELLRMHED